MRWLDDQEAEAWRAVRDLGRPLWTALGRDLQRDSGLSLADYEVLVVLSAAPGGVLPYRELAASTGWEKSRLSHHVTRMEQRQLVQRLECPGDARSANVSLTDAGREAIGQAAPGHVESVRGMLIDRLSAEQLAVLVEIGRTVREALHGRGIPGVDLEGCEGPAGSVARAAVDGGHASGDDYCAADAGADDSVSDGYGGADHGGAGSGGAVDPGGADPGGDEALSAITVSAVRADR